MVHVTTAATEGATDRGGTAATTASRGPVALSRRRLSRYVGLILPVSLLALWEFLAGIGVIDSAYFPPPSRIAARAVEMGRNGDLLTDFAATLGRIVVGFAIGALVGYATGILTGVFLFARRLLEPTLSAIYTVPKLALLPIFLLIFGFGEAPKISLVAVTVFFYVWIYTMEAVVRIPVGYLDAAASFRADRWQTFVHVIGPGTLPAVFTGLRIAVAVSVLVTISSDFIIGSSGLGYLIFNSRSLFRIEDAFVGILAVAVLGFVLQAIVVRIGNRVTPWSHHSTVTSAKVRI